MPGDMVPHPTRFRLPEYQPSGMEVPTKFYPWEGEWDNNLCELCNITDFRAIFGSASWDRAPQPGAFGESDGEVPRTFAYVRDHQSCAFCRLIYHGLKNSDNWYCEEERAVWLSARAFAWFLTLGKDHKFHCRVEKKICLRVQRDCYEPWEQETEVLTEQVAQIQTCSQQPDCATNSAWYELLARYKANGCDDVFNVSDYERPEDKELVENIHSLACCGRWVPRDRINFDMVKNWLWLCDGFHDEQCRPQVQQDKFSFEFPRRLIDVQRGSVVYAPAKCRYICLSYVWGGVKQLILNDRTIDKLSEDGGIYEAYTDQSGQETRLSRTVEDAIRATQMLGEQYLWVDACCIKQDDVSGSKMEEVKAMDAIYSQASLTIVAAAGNSANAGLPGVREGSRNVLQHIEVVRNHSLMMTVSPTHDLDVSVWERRSWTMQERILSRRLLVFTTSQVYFSCRQTRFLEDTVCELATSDIQVEDCPRYSEHWNSIYVADDKRGGFNHYRNLVREYTTRKTSYPTDALNACEGLLSDYRKYSGADDSRFAFGLPLSDFSAALCWTAFPHNPESRREGFPSWSWAGWDSMAVYRESGFTADVQIRSNMIQPAEADESNDGRQCQEACPQSLQCFDPTSPILQFKAVMFKLCVSRAEDTWAGGRKAYKLTSPDNAAHCVGAINLDKAWRTSRTDLLDFIILGFSVQKSGEENSYGFKLLCIEWVGDIAYRVQLAYDPPMDDSSYYKPPGQGRQSLESLRRLGSMPDDYTLITLH